MSASFSICPRAVGIYRPSSPHTSTFSDPPHLPPLLLPPSHSSASSFLGHHTSRSIKLAEPRELYHHHPYAHAFNDNASRNYTTGPGTAYEYLHIRLPQIGNPGTANSRSQITLPPPQLPLPPIVPSPHSHLQTPHQHTLPLPLPHTQRESGNQRLCSSSAPGRHPSVSNISTGVSPERGQTPLPIGRIDSNSDANLYCPSTSHSQRNSQSSLYFRPIAAAEGRRESARMETNPLAFNKATGTDISKPSLDLKPVLSPIPARHVPTTTPPVLTPQKSRRVRTGCLTCRERHLKCDEGVPDCANCRKGARECKRGIRLNFIDIQTKPIPFIPEATCWKVSFMDESRTIADEYAGGLDRYPRAPNIPRLNRSPCTTATFQQLPDQAQYENGNTTSQPPPMSFQQTRTAPLPSTQHSCFAPQQSHHPQHPQYPQYSQYQYPQYPQFPQHSLQNNTRTGTEALVEVNTRNITNFLGLKYDQKDGQCDSPRSDTSSIASSMVPEGAGGPSPIASFQADVENTPTSVDVACDIGDGGNDTGLHDTLPEGLPTPPSEKFGPLRGDGPGVRFGVTRRLENVSSSRDSNSSERDYLQSPEEVLYMRVFVAKVGAWMDSLDKDNHFSRVIPRMAIKSPMMHNAFLACGVKHLSLVDDAYRNGRALHYYDTATTQLLRGLQNPDRDVVESATTAAILSVYEAMNERLDDRKIHTIGARGLIKDCGWTAKSKDIGGACFWLSIGLEVLSCLEFKWAMAWDPDQWGLDDEFTNAINNKPDSIPGHENGSKQTATKARRPNAPSEAVAAITGGDGEQAWTHRILYIVAKVANFRASVPRFQEPSPHDEQFRLQNRFSEWKALKSMCDKWNDDCPQSMRPYSYLLPVEGDTSGSLFPNIWLLEPTAVIGRLFYHTAMVLLHQVNPVESSDSRVNLNAQRHHAHQVCGIISHSNNLGIASVAMRSLTIAALVLSDVREQNEAHALLRNISKATGWRIGHVYAELQNAWGRDLAESDAPSAATAPAFSNLLPPPSDLPMAGVFSGNLGFAPNQGTNLGLNPGLGPGFPMAFLSQRSSFSPTSQSPADGRLHLPGSGGGPEYGRASHLRMQSTTSIISSGTLTGAVTPHLSPLTANAYRLPLVNPLLQADLGLPDHPYKAFYKQPNDSVQYRLASI